MCNSGCDACAASPGASPGPSADGSGNSRLEPPMQDVSSECRGMLAALAALPATDERATLIQLVDRWRALKVRRHIRRLWNHVSWLFCYLVMHFWDQHHSLSWHQLAPKLAMLLTGGCRRRRCIW